MLRWNVDVVILFDQATTRRQQWKKDTCSIHAVNVSDAGERAIRYMRKRYTTPAEILVTNVTTNLQETVEVYYSITMGRGNGREFGRKLRQFLSEVRDDCGLTSVKLKKFYKHDTN